MWAQPRDVVRPPPTATGRISMSGADGRALQSQLMASRAGSPDPESSETAGVEANAQAARWPRIGARYQISAELGRGGMAAVYRALDAVSGRELALKQLTLQSDPKRARESALLF